MLMANDETISDEVTRTSAREKGQADKLWKRLWKILGILLGTALLLNVVTEILNRKSFVGTVRFMIHAPMVFLLDTLLLLAPFLLVFLQGTKYFWRLCSW